MGASLHSSWLDTVRRDPTATALIDAASGQAWTREELSSAVQAWRDALPAGLDLRQQIVVFAVPNGLEWLTVFLGLQAAGALVAALDPQEPPEAQTRLARALHARFLWLNGHLIEVNTHDREEPSGETPSATVPPPKRSRQTCLLKITSGSTGTPKALAFTHAQMLADGRQVCATMDIRPSDRNLAVIPFGHSYGLGNLVVPLIEQGTALVCTASPLPQALAADCARWQTTVFPAVPALLRAMAGSDLAPESLGSLRVIISAGAPLAKEAATAFAEKFGRRIHNFYGSSETGGICYDRTGEATLSGQSVGRPLEGVTLRFRAGQRFSVASAAVMGRGRFSIADRGSLNAAGELQLLGRADRGVKIAGRRLDLGEIEAALRAVPGVRDAWVLPHPQRPDALAAAVATELTPEQVRTALADRLATWKIPARVVPLNEFPLTARGKTDTRALRLLLSGTKT